MNLHAITRTEADMVPDARAIEAREDGKVYVLRCGDCEGVAEVMRNVEVSG